ncbi:MAG: COG1470 family protein [Promethearchaeota archaeon]
MKEYEKKSISVFVIIIIFASIFSYGFVALVLTEKSQVSKPEAAESIPLLADEDTIEDPRGQDVEQSHILELGRRATLDLIKPIDWSLDIFDFKVISAQIPMDLNLTLGIKFPLKAKASYDPYDVHPSSSFPFLVEIDNTGCTPSILVGVDFEMDFAGLNFNFLGLGNLLSFAATWGTIEYNNDFEIPFYGVQTKLGNWISYDILDKYYSLSDILGVDLDWDQFKISGGVGVNIQYNLYSYLTAKAIVDTPYSSPSATNLRWNDLGAKTFNVNLNSSATHGDILTVEIGDWVYHIAHDVTFKVWADINLEVLSLDIIDQDFTYKYTLSLGELTFPEMEDFKFEFNPEVLAGKSVHNVDATWSPFGFDYGPNGGNFQVFDYTIGIPANEELQNWLDNMNVDFALGASINIDFPFNMKSYYNARKVTPGNVFDYNVIVDSIGATSPNINYNVDFMLDLSNVEIFGYSLDKYEYQLGGVIYSLDGTNTPFGSRVTDIEITNMIGLDQLSKMLNEYISNMLYGINPDIQFRAWVVFQFDAYLTGTIELTNGATVLEATEFKWDSQFDTQTSRILVPDTLSPGETFNITYKDLTYHLQVTPGIKLGVSVLGGIIGFDYTFMIPGVSQYLQKDFYAPNFEEEIAVNQLGFNANALTVSDPIAYSGDYNVGGTFVITNIGTISDSYVIELITDDLPTGTTGSWSGGNFPSTTTISSSPGSNSKVIDWSITLGANAHTTEYKKNNLVFVVKSNTDGNLIAVLSYQLDIWADPGIIDTEVTMEDELDINPGLEVIVPAIIQNNGLDTVDYSISLSGNGTSYVTNNTAMNFQVSPGNNATFELSVDIPADPSSTAGDYEVITTIHQVGGPDIVKPMIFTIPEFMQVSMELISADEEVEIDEGADFNFILSNQGNIAGDVNVSVVGINGAEINGLPAPQTINLLSGASGVACLVSFGPEDLSPGLNEFNITIERNGEILISQNFTIHVAQLTCSVSSDGYQYEGQPLNYQITLTNQGPNMDTFVVEIVGLDSSAYTLDPRASGVAIAGGGSSITLDLTIAPTDIKKVYGGTNGFGIKIKSSSYSYDDIIGASGVIMPEVYDIDLPENPLIIQEDYIYDMKFVIQNNGNLGDIFTIQVENIGSDVTYEIISVGLAENSDNQIQVRRGESIEVIIRFHKNMEGRYNPVVKVLNGEGQLAATYTGDYWVGLIYSPFFIAALILSISAAAGGAMYVVLYSKGIITPGAAGRFSNRLTSATSKIKSKLSHAKNKIKYKITNATEDRDVVKVEKEFIKREQKAKKYIEADEPLSTQTPELKDVIKKGELKKLKTKSNTEKIPESSKEKAEKYWNLDEEEDFEDFEDFNDF